MDTRVAVAPVTMLCKLVQIKDPTMKSCPGIFLFRFRTILDSLMKLSGTEQMDGLKAFVEACKNTVCSLDLESGLYGHL